MADTLKKLDKYRSIHAKAAAKADELNKKVETAGGEDKADFYLLQSRNLACCDEKTALDHMVKIIGGFFVVNEDTTGRDALLREYEANVKRAQAARALREADLDLDHIAQLPAQEITAKIEKQKRELEARRPMLVKALEEAEAETAKATVKVNALRAQNAGKGEFDRYEAMRDEGIDLSRLTYDEMRILRKDLQIIFQDPYSSLNPRFTIGQIIEEGLVTHNFYHSGSSQMREHVVDTLVECGLQPVYAPPLSPSVFRRPAAAHFPLPVRWRFIRSLSSATSASRRWMCRFSPRLSTCWRN